jgi:hypothetical protein
VRFTTAAALVNELVEAKQQLQLRRVLARTCSSTRLLLAGWAAGEVPRVRAFSDGLPPNRACHVSEHPALQCFKPRRALQRGDPRG